MVSAPAPANRAVPAPRRPALFRAPDGQHTAGALLRLALFLNTGNQTLKSETKLSQQFLPTREPEARYRVVISTLLHRKLLTHFTHQQE
jgi:hypothetical protein